MSTAVKSDGTVERAFASFIDNQMSRMSKEEIDDLIKSMEPYPEEGGQPKLDKCTMISLLRFNTKYFELFGETCIPACYYLSVKLTQSPLIGKYKRPTSGKRQEADCVKILRG